MGVCYILYDQIGFCICIISLLLCWQGKYMEWLIDSDFFGFDFVVWLVVLCGQFVNFGDYVDFEIVIVDENIYEFCSYMVVILGQGNYVIMLILDWIEEWQWVKILYFLFLEVSYWLKNLLVIVQGIVLYIVCFIGNFDEFLVKFCGWFYVLV